MLHISVIGHFGEGKNLLNGQTVKTKIITEELIKEFGINQVSLIDTHGGLKNLFKAPFQVFKALRSSANTLIFPAHNGLRIYVPLLSFMKVFFNNRKFHYIVIGGWLPQFLANRKFLAKLLKNFDHIYVETETMKKALEKQGFANILVMTNCKKLKILSENELPLQPYAPYRLCTFSRVMKEKGIEDAINAVTTINNELGYVAYTLDIFGQIEPMQQNWFLNIQNNLPTFIKYCGLVPYEQSSTTLKNYFALLFPTYYDGEGFPGTLIDAFSAGIPVIASDWKYNAEIINENVGFVFPTGDGNALNAILKDILKNPELLLSKKSNCLEEAHKYEIDNVIKILISQIH